MKKVFMILGTCLMAAMVVVSCNKNNDPKPDPKPDDKEQGGEEQGGEEQGFTMEVSIDGDFSEWDALTEQTADGEYFIYEENTSSDLNGMLRLKLTSDKDNIYVYTELAYENIVLVEDGPYTEGSSAYGFGPQGEKAHPGTPGALIIYVGGDGNDSKLYAARGSLWSYAGFDAFPQYYFAWDVAANKMQLGWPQNNWPEIDEELWGEPLTGHDVGWASDTPDHDYDVTGKDDIKFSNVVSLTDPVSKKTVQAIKIEFSMARDAIMGPGTMVNGDAYIGAFYENVGDGTDGIHQTWEDGSGKIPSGDTAIKLKLK